jgi:hypothetical protein
MNGLSRKLHALEDSLLEFPPDDKDILMFIGDANEQTLHDKAEKIRENRFRRIKQVSGIQAQKACLQVFRSGLS